MTPAGLRLYAIPYSTNVERVALALGHKGVAAEVVMCDRGRPLADPRRERPGPGARARRRRLLRDRLEPDHRAPRAPLPGSAAVPGRAGPAAPRCGVFVDWFDRVWKGPPNAIDAELGRPEPDHIRVAALEHELRSTLDVFEAMLDGRDYLMSGSLSAADCAAFPFLKYGLWIQPGDDERFHQILARNLALDGDHPRVEAGSGASPPTPASDGIVTYDGD